MGEDIVKDLPLVCLAGGLQHPAIPLLNQVILIQEQDIGQLEDILQKFPLPGRHDQRYGRRAPHPAVGGGRPAFERG